MGQGRPEVQQPVPADRLRRPGVPEVGRRGHGVDLPQCHFSRQSRGLPDTAHDRRARVVRGPLRAGQPASRAASLGRSPARRPGRRHERRQGTVRQRRHRPGGHDRCVRGELVPPTRSPPGDHHWEVFVTAEGRARLLSWLVRLGVSRPRARLRRRAAAIERIYAADLATPSQRASSRRRSFRVLSGSSLGGWALPVPQAVAGQRRQLGVVVQMQVAAVLVLVASTGASLP